MSRKEVFTKWIAALRSGSYEQGKRKMKSPDNKYCCIGVLAEVMGLGEWEPKEWGSVLLKQKEPRSGGLDNDNLEKCFLSKDEQGFLCYVNDVRNKSFEEIADILEDNIDKEIGPKEVGFIYENR